METLEKLKKLDLETCSIEEIDSLLNSIGPLPIMKTDYGNGKLFVRAIRNTNPDTDFALVSRLSYCPPEFNKNFLRASTPDNTMFYGSVIKDNYTQQDIDYARITACCETSELLRNNTILEGERIITLGTWRVRGQLEVATIFDPTKEYTIDYLQNIKNAYLESIEHHPELKEKGLAYLEFLASEFSKDVKDGENYKYLISALFARIAAQKSDGVLYPSVRAAGVGLCVALKPEVMNQLELLRVDKCLLKKENGGVTITYLKTCDVENDASEFELLEYNEYINRRKS